MTQEDAEANRARLAALMESGKLDTAAVAEILTAQTKRPCSRRTVQAWLSEPDKPSARSCPDWAVELLEAKLKRMRKE